VITLKTKKQHKQQHKTATNKPLAPLLLAVEEVPGINSNSSLKSIVPQYN
jgi:hypothetical protein